MSFCQQCGNKLEGPFCMSCGAANPDAQKAVREDHVRQFELNMDVNDIPDAPAAPPQQAAPTPPPYGTPVSSYTSVETPPYNYPPQYPVYTASSQEQPISVGGWIGRCLIPCIPVVGGLIYFIMLFIWMDDKNKEETFRNWAKAQLLVMLIMLGLVFLLAIVIFMFFGMTVASFGEVIYG